MIYENRLILDNPSTQYFHQPITPQNLASHPKNPSICKFMIQLGRFDELGSGVINIHKYLPAYSDGAQPLFEDPREGFRLSLLSEAKKKIPSVTGQSSGAESGAESIPPQVTPQVILFLKILQGELSRMQIMEKLTLKDREHFREHYLQKALYSGLIEYTIPDKLTNRLQKNRLTEKVFRNKHRKLLLFSCP